MKGNAFFYVGGYGNGFKVAVDALLASQMLFFAKGCNEQLSGGGGNGYYYLFVVALCFLGYYGDVVVVDVIRCKVSYIADAKRGEAAY